MIWDNFHIYSLMSVALWIGGAVFAWTGRDFPKEAAMAGSELKRRGSELKRGGFSSLALLLFGAGILIFASFIWRLWIELGHPPFKTMGETRLWYSLFMAVAGCFTYIMWKFKWVLSFSALMSLIFAAINIAKPEIHSQELMPALQSGWFIPHVAFFIFSYAFFGAAFILAVVGFFIKKIKIIPSIDTLVTIGITFFTFGMLFGALWAKEAWGDFWTWDPKESWALASLFIYLIYLHARKGIKSNSRILYAIIIFGFLSLQMCWWGINYLPSATESIHSYTIK